MNFIQRFLHRDQRAKVQRSRAFRAQEIENLGFQMIDRSGWADGKYASKAYFLAQNGEDVAGPFSSSSEALEAARRLGRGD